MANVCTFVIRIKGEKEKVEKFPIDDLSCYEIGVKKERKTKSGRILKEIHGKCAWSIDGSLLNGNSRVLPFVALSKKYDLEIEIFGYDMNNVLAGEYYAEHCIYDKGIILKELKDNPFVPVDEWDDYCFGRDEIKERYSIVEAENTYALKNEYKTFIEYDKEKEKVILPWEKLIY